MELVTFETAKLAKEKGFKELCYWYYTGDEKLYESFLENGSSSDTDFRVDLTELGDNYNDGAKVDKNGNRCWGCNSKNYFLMYSAPTQSHLKKWLRDNHNIDVDVTRDTEIHYQDETRWCVRISNFNNIEEVKTPIAHIKHPEHCHLNDFKSYELALEAGLLKGLTYVK